MSIGIWEMREVRDRMQEKFREHFGKLSNKMFEDMALMVGRHRGHTSWNEPMSFIVLDEDQDDSEIYRKMEMLAGPYGHAIYKAWLAKQEG